MHLIVRWRNMSIRKRLGCIKFVKKNRCWSFRYWRKLMLRRAHADDLKLCAYRRIFKVINYNILLGLSNLLVTRQHRKEELPSHTITIFTRRQSLL